MMNRLRRALLPILVFTKIDVKRAFRDKVAIFFIFLFPLIFLFVFGGIFGKNNDASFNVALINQAKNTYSQDFVGDLKKDNLIKVDEDVARMDQANEKMARGEIDAIIVLPQTFGNTNKKTSTPGGEAEIIYSENTAQAGQTLSSIFNAMFQEMNKKLVKTETPFTVKTTKTTAEGADSFDYIFSGLLGFTILTLGVFGPTEVFPKLKQKGVLRRYHTTSLKVWQYFTANVISNIIVGLLSIALMFAVATFVPMFSLKMQGDYGSLALIIILGTMVMFGIGLAVGGWAKNPNQAAPLANLITFPMMFLSGTFFPRFLMPEWLQTISGYFPLTPVIDSARLIITEGKTLLDLGPQIGLLALWAFIIYAVAFKVFRWE